MCADAVNNIKLDDSFSRELRDRTYEIIHDNGKGSTYSNAEKDYLLTQAQAFTDIFNNNWRIAVPSPTGFGKSVMLKTFILLLHEKGIADGVIIYLSNLNEMNKTILDIIDFGVPKEKLGVHFSNTSSSIHNDMPCYCEIDELKNKQFIIITQQKAYANAHKSIEDMQDIYIKDGINRIGIWDEAIETATYTDVKTEDIINTISSLKLRYRNNKVLHSREGENDQIEDNTDLHNLITYLNKVDDLCYQEPHTFTLPDSSTFNLEYCKNIFRGKNKDEYDHIKNIINFETDKIQHTKDISNSGNHFLSIRPNIPEYLDKILVLDASVSINYLLNKYDSTFDKIIKSEVKRDYSNCTIWKVKLGSGRSSINQGNKYKKGDVTLTETVENYIDITNHFIESIQSHSKEVMIGIQTTSPENITLGKIDLEKVVTQEIKNSKPVTFGKHTGRNDLSDIDIGAIINGWNLPQKVANQSIISQKQDIDYYPTYDEINNVLISHKAMAYYQLIGRMKRQYTEGKSEPWNFLIIDYDVDKIVDELSIVLPKVNKAYFELPLHVASKLSPRSTKVISLCETLLEIAESEPKITAISSQRLFKMYEQKTGNKIKDTEWRGRPSDGYRGIRDNMSSLLKNRWEYSTKRRSFIKLTE